MEFEVTENSCGTTHIHETEEYWCRIRKYNDTSYTGYPTVYVFFKEFETFTEVSFSLQNRDISNEELVNECIKLNKFLNKKYGTEDHPINKDIEKANEESKVTEEVKQVVSAADRLKAMKAKVEYEMMLLGLRR